MPKSAKNKRSQPIAAVAASGPYPRLGSTSTSSAAGKNLIAPKTELGQHFLKNPAVISAIIQKSGVKGTDVVLEIGPGTVMFQEAFALRLTARPGEALYCRLSVNTQLLAKVDQLLKVGKQNFRPPPKVESRVVRIEPKNPPPPVNFEEWDGMIRLLFNRKNKTLRASLTTKSVLKMLEDNRKTVMSLRSADSDVEMDERPVQDVIEEILQRVNWKDKRASKLDLDEFLQLLSEFNEAGIHFS